MKIIFTLSILLIQTHLFAQCEGEATFEFENVCKLEYSSIEYDIIRKIEIDDARFYRSAYLRYGEDSIRLNGAWIICYLDSTSMELMRTDYWSAQRIQYPKFNFFGYSLECFSNNESTYMQRTSVEFVVSDTLLTLTFQPSSREPGIYSYIVEYYDGTTLLLRKPELPMDSPKESVILQISRNAMTRE